jgi:amino acid permease
MTSVTKLQLKTWGLFLIAALMAEIVTSWWTFTRAPTDGLRPVFDMSFVSYETDRITSWLVFFFVASFIASLISRKQLVRHWK